MRQIRRVHLSHQRQLLQHYQYHMLWLSGFDVPRGGRLGVGNRVTVVCTGTLARRAGTVTVRAREDGRAVNFSATFVFFMASSLFSGFVAPSLFLSPSLLAFVSLLRLLVGIVGIPWNIQTDQKRWLVAVAAAVWSHKILSSVISSVCLGECTRVVDVNYKNLLSVLI